MEQSKANGRSRRHGAISAVRGTMLGAASALLVGACTRVVVVLARDDVTTGVGDACAASDATNSIGADGDSAPDSSATSRSCGAGLTCGDASCCESKLLPGGTFRQGRASSGPENEVCFTWAVGLCNDDEQQEFASTVSAFSLDTYEVTVGRFRAFVAAYPGSKPTPGAGANPSIPGSGWNAAWDDSLTDQVTLITNLSCDGGYATWTNGPGANENKPINCVDWFEAFAFCAWDGGRLPTEAEWEYAASGGENRVTPWEVPPDQTAPDKSRACFDQKSPIPSVGSTPLGVSRWGQQDLAGSVLEWTSDWYGPYPMASVTNYGGAASGTERVLRGGSFYFPAGGLRAALRPHYVPTGRYSPMGLRCARDVR